MFAALGLLLAAAAVASPAGASRPRVEVVLSVDAGVAIDAGDLRAIADDVRRIWRDAADVTVSLPGDLTRPVAVDTVRLVLTGDVRASADRAGLGWIEFVNGEPQRTITVSVGAARMLVWNARWYGKPMNTLPPAAARTFLRRAVARAAAHEIGHYLFRTKAHTHGGLMRAAFTPDEMVDTRPALDRLNAADIARLRESAERVAEMKSHIDEVAN
jgi:hypothetical protein